MSHLANKKFFRIVAVCAIATISLSACASNNMSGPTSSQSVDGMMGNESSLSAADIMFLQMMIPHHEQAIEMSDLALAISKNSEVLKLAQQIKAAQSAEIVSMKSWLQDAGMSEDMGHEMDHGMGGMMTAEELASLKSATGKEFDRQFLTSMIAHHEGALHMVMMIKDSEDSNLRTLYQNIVKTQTEEIEWMKRVL